MNLMEINDPETEDILVHQNEALNNAGCLLDDNQNLITPDKVTICVQLLSFFLAHLKKEFPDAYDYCIKHLIENIEKNIKYTESTWKQTMN